MRGLVGTVIYTIILFREYNNGAHRTNALLLRSGKNVEGVPGQYYGYHDKK